MASKKLERQLALDALAGKRPGAELVVRGVTVFAEARRTVGRIGLEGGVITPDKDRTRLMFPYGNRVDLLHASGKTAGGMAILAVHTLKSGRTERTQLPGVAAGWIVDCARGNVDVLAKALAGIERARRALFDAAEKSTRWL